MRKIFEHRSTLPGTVSEVIKIHEEPSMFSRLTMPPLRAQIVRDERKSLDQGEIEFVLWFGFIPVRWIARHETGPVSTSFKDVQVEGPLAYWSHEHIFVEKDNQTELVDRITLEHKVGLKGFLTRLLFDGLPLRILFIYRHWQTRKFLNEYSHMYPANMQPGGNSK